MSRKPVEEEKIDIGQLASDLTVHSVGKLKRLDDAHRITYRWFRARMILLLSAATIVLILVASLVILGFSADESSLSWARQTLTALMGFGAGSIWSANQAHGAESE